ncbi:double-strand break repair protein AddB [Radicibacter daui]|uniref:double-strand break repair protein AddB n=1 Tax=Radicibacter daui TaxID=3064829 RepID=UPI004046E2DB
MTPGPDQPAAQVFTVAPGLPFTDVLAAGIRDRWGDAPEALAALTLLLPTRRACRALREAFLRQGDGAPLLLPRMVPVGELDADELSLTGDGEMADDGSLVPAISPLRRQILLTALIARAGDEFAAGPAQAAGLAGELARLLDEIGTEGLTPDVLTGLLPKEHEFAEHWQRTLHFLDVIISVWPAILAEEGVQDPAAWRNAVLEAQTERWRQTPPDGPVIAAGITGSVPATAALLAVIARLPQGQVVLPGLDREMDEESWQVAEESHPQHDLRRTLERIGIQRGAVQDWQSSWPLVPMPWRQALWTEVLRPAATTESWRELAGSPLATSLDTATDGLRFIECADAQTEAGAIALILREALERPAQTAALVTRDRTLARRVVSQLARWGLDVDDSAGQPLAETPAGAFLTLTADMVLERCAPIPLLTALKHPFAACGLAPDRFRRRLRQLERRILRGPRPAPGMEGLLAALTATTTPGEHQAQEEDLARFLSDLDRRIAGFAAILTGPPIPFAHFLRAHLAAAEALAASDAEQGPDRLWRGQDGLTAARFAAELIEAVAEFPAISGGEYPAMLATFMAGISVRQPFGKHPRLFIWGPMEARLQQADIMVLGGLNEGSWPPLAAADPWLSRTMRRQLGLPSPEARVGRAAHDFVAAATGPAIYLSRARRVDGVPTVPARWLLRLDTVLKGLGSSLSSLADPRWPAWAAAMDTPEIVRPCLPPTPKPPVSARPRRLSVTEIETWQRDPYAIYARRILGLAALDDIDADPGAAERGQFIHTALDLFVREHGDSLPPDALAKLTAIGRACFGDALARPEVRAFWWPRFEAVAAWFLATEQERRQHARPLATEVKGSVTLAGPVGPFELYGRVDRIDRHRADSSLEIIDYKTGQPPTDAAVRTGAAPQLPLLGLIAEMGSFEGIAAGSKVGALAYWHLSGRDPAGKEQPVKAEIGMLIEMARDGLLRLIAEFDQEAMPYLSRPRPEHAPRYSDYEHLARVAEWSLTESP